MALIVIACIVIPTVLLGILALSLILEGNKARRKELEQIERQRHHKR